MGLSLSSTLVAKRVLIAINYCDHHDNLLEQKQVYGTIIKADAKDGFAIRLEGQKKETCSGFHLTSAPFKTLSLASIAPARPAKSSLIQTSSRTGQLTAPVIKEKLFGGAYRYDSAASLLESLDEEVDEGAEAAWAEEITKRIHELYSGVSRRSRGPKRVAEFLSGSAGRAAHFRVEEGAWDHEYCAACEETVPATTLCWVTETGPFIVLCPKCKEQARRVVRFSPASSGSR